VFGALASVQGKQHTSERAELPRRRQMLLKGEEERKRLGILLLGEVQ
jgi:hypothetical protein